MNIGVQHQSTECEHYAMAITWIAISGQIQPVKKSQDHLTFLDQEGTDLILLLIWFFLRQFF